jgi:DNA-binding transcriptional LysR family regulator
VAGASARSASAKAGERYAAACRRVLTDLEEADLLAAGEGAAPRGVLTITAPLVSGTQVLRPIVDAFLDAQPAVRAKFFLLDRPVSLVEEGIDIALRIAHLPDSSLIAIRIGEVRRAVCAAPSYLASRAPIVEPGDLSEHSIVAMTTFDRIRGPLRRQRRMALRAHSLYRPARG